MIRVKMIKLEPQVPTTPQNPTQNKHNRENMIGFDQRRKLRWLD
jgi:hypothetical protein